MWHLRRATKDKPAVPTPVSPIKASELGSGTAVTRKANSPAAVWPVDPQLLLIDSLTKRASVDAPNENSCTVNGIEGDKLALKLPKFVNVPNDASLEENKEKLLIPEFGTTFQRANPFKANELPRSN